MFCVCALVRALNDAKNYAERDSALRLGWNPSVDAPKKPLACIDDIPFSPDTDVPCHAHPMGAAQILLFERHLIPNVSRCLGQIVSSR